jgi:cytochrome c556
MKSLILSATALFLLTAVTANADTAMEGSMKKVSDACKQLGPDLKQTDDTKHNKDADLASVATIKTESLNSRGLVPKKAKYLPPDQQQAMIADFQKDMDSFLQDVETLNQDIQTDKWNAARIDFKKLTDDERASHKQFRVKK